MQILREKLEEERDDGVVQAPKDVDGKEEEEEEEEQGRQEERVPPTEEKRQCMG